MAITTQAGTSALTKERSKGRASLTQLAFLVTEVDVDFIALQLLLTLRQGFILLNHGERDMVEPK